MKEQKLAPGYYKVVRSHEEKARDYAVTPESVREMLSRVDSKQIADAIAARIGKTTVAGVRK